MARNQLNRYQRIIEKIFLDRYSPGAQEIEFSRADIVAVAQDLNISLPSNVGDVIYTFRYRAALPESVRAKVPSGREWIIRPSGRSRYRFVAVQAAAISPNPLLVEIKVPDATPGLIAMYALSDEQALLAKVRYNRLLDIFTGVACYSLQSHMRTTVPGMGQVETDEIYIGLDRRGAHYVFPVQAKGSGEQLGIVQIEQDFAHCAPKFPTLSCRAIGTQFMNNETIALFSFELSENGIAIATERHYRLVAPQDLSPDELISYRDSFN